jgi:hypothetical protein
MQFDSKLLSETPKIIWNHPVFFYRISLQRQQTVYSDVVEVSTRRQRSAGFYKRVYAGLVTHPPSIIVA